MKRILALGAAMLLAAGTAMAGHCPTKMKAIDEALAKKPTLSAADMAAVTKARADGEAFHKAGKHAESIAELDKGMKILKLDAPKK